MLLAERKDWRKWVLGTRDTSRKAAAVAEHDLSQHQHIVQHVSTMYKKSKYKDKVQGLDQQDNLILPYLSKLASVNWNEKPKAAGSMYTWTTFGETW